MRIFACSLLSGEVEAAYASHVATLVSSSAGTLRLIPRHTAHITYAFMSHVADERATDLASAVVAVAERHAPIVVRLGAPFVLYGGSEARLVCAPVTNGLTSLSRLAADVVAALEAVLPSGAVSASRSQHVTLARFAKKTRRSTAGPVEEVLERTAMIVSEERIARLQLMSSALTPAGPVYTPLVNVSLGRARIA